MPRTGRVHTSYGQAVAVTGRLASNDPNLQNIPIRTAEGRRIRAAFIAPAGSCHRLRRLFADRAAHHGAPVQRRAAAGSLRPRRGHAPRHRRRGVRRHAARKSTASSGATPRSSTSASSTACPPSAWRASWASSAAPPRPTSTATSPAIPASRATWRRRGSRRATRATSRPCSAAACGCPRSSSSNVGRRQGAERAAINAPMQGTAADLIKLAMIAVQRLARRASAGDAADPAGA